MDEPFDIDDVTVEGMEPGGTTMLLRLECAKGPILLRIPVEKAQHLASIMEWAVTPNEALMQGGDQVTALGPVETVKKVTIGKAVHGEADQVLVSMETSSGGRLNLLLDKKVTEDMAVGLFAALATGRQKH